MYGGKVFPLAIGAVVVGVPTTFQIPLSGDFSPVLRVVPSGTRVLVVIVKNLKSDTRMAITPLLD